MKRIKHALIMFMASIMLIATTIPPVYAQEKHSSTTDLEQLYEHLMQRSESAFLREISYICEVPDSEQLAVVGIALSERNDISEDELIQLILDADSAYYLRRIAVESYAMRSPTSVDSRILELIADENESYDLRMIMVSLLGDFMETSNIPLLISTANSADNDLAYNSIKALERIDAETAVKIATTIYNNYENETPARINIAAKVLARNLANDTQRNFHESTTMTEAEFLAQSAEIFNNTKNDEIRHAISSATGSPTIAVIASRATGKQGYAAYRDGVTSAGIEINWHTGIITAGSSAAAYTFAHAAGTGSTTGTTNYLGFIDEGSPMGYYRPASTALSSSKRDAVCATATALANEHIGYVFATPIRYSISSIATDKYPISDIVAIRCDGFVEYAYEYNDIRVYGDDTYWNISKAGDSYTDEHGGFQLTPRIQANEYMVRLGNL